MSRRTVLAFGVLLSIFSLALSITGGFVTTVFDVRLSARSPQPAAIAAAAAFGVWLVLAWRARRLCEDLTRLEAWLVAHANASVLTVAAIAGAVAIRHCSFSAGSSDPSGYLSQAAMLQGADLVRAEPLAALADWPDAIRTLAPLGWRPSIESSLQVPTYAIGLPLLMAPLHASGGLVAATLIVPVSFALAIWATGAVALRIAGPLAAVLAAVWFATSPVALIEAMQPMSDVPVTAAWLVCWWLLLRQPSGPTRGFALAAGVAAAAAVLIRPNLAPLAVTPAAFVVLRSPKRLPAVSAFSAPVAVAGLIVGYLQWRWFGSSLRSGYGTATEIYALSSFAPNLTLYGRWLLASHGVWLFLAPLAFVWPWRFKQGRVSQTTNANTLRWLLVFAAGVVAAYLFYNVFEVWTYLRFMLPALAIAMVAVAAMIVSLIARLPAAAHAPAFLVVLLTLAASNVMSAQSLGVFRFASVQSRAALAGRYLDAMLPTDAVVLSGEQSGSVRYYTDRSIVRWDFAAVDGLDPITARLEHLGRDIWIALDVWEEELFRRKFPGSAAGALDWPPRVEAGTEMLMRAWRLRDRDVFMRGEEVVTDRLR